MPIHVNFGSALSTGLASVVECCDLSGNCFCCTLGCSFTIALLFITVSLSIVVTVLMGGLFSSSLSSSSLSSLAELSVKIDLNKSIGGLSSSVTYMQNKNYISYTEKISSNFKCLLSAVGSA